MDATQTHRPQPYRYTSNQSAPSNVPEDLSDNETLLPADRISPSKPRRSSALEWRTYAVYIPNTAWTKTLTIILLVQAAVCIGLESYIFGRFEASLFEGAIRAGSVGHVAAVGLMPALLATMIFESLYQVFLSLDAARLRNIVQVAGICLNNMSMMIFIVLALLSVLDACKMLVRIRQIEPDTYTSLKGLFVGLITVTALSTVVLGLVTWKLLHEFQWAIYRHISVGDLQLRKRYLIYEVYIALLHLDFFFLLGFWIQLVTAIPHSSKRVNPLFYVAVAALVLTPLQLLLAGYSARHESVIGQGIAALLFSTDIVFVSLQLAKMYSDGRLEREFLPLRQRTTAYAAMAIPLLIVTIVMVGITTRNFNRGLKPHLQTSRVPAGSDMDNVRRHRGYEQMRGDAQQLDTLAPRMTIE